MARDSIVEKLDQETRLVLRRESQVLYIVAEIRKVIEHERERAPTAYEVLELFCNWALHIRISRKSNAERIRLFFAAFDMKDGMSMHDFFRTEFFNRMMQLSVLRCEMRRFLMDHGLPCTLVNEHKSWSAFIYLYTSIVSEVPTEHEWRSAPRRGRKLDNYAYGTKRNSTDDDEMGDQATERQGILWRNSLRPIP